jgi:Asp-tRNA(Asn)/Glu-tRNA(Gln) amidotransferase A subunit family amidase
VFNVPALMLGIPALALPLLLAEGLPLGLQIAGFAGEDARLFATAAAIRDLLTPAVILSLRPPRTWFHPVS